MLFFYNLALIVALVASAPWWLWRMVTTHKYRQGLGERLGFVRIRRARRAISAGAESATGRPAIWLHAVSVGEVLAVAHLVAELDRTLPEFQILISTTTRTGQDLARSIDLAATRQNHLATEIFASLPLLASISSPISATARISMTPHPNLSREAADSAQSQSHRCFRRQSG